jgi:hypothetical protein
MKLNSPKQITWWIALAAGAVGTVVGIVGFVLPMTLVSVIGFCLVVAACALTLLSTVLKGL